MLLYYIIYPFIFNHNYKNLLIVLIIIYNNNIIVNMEEKLTINQSNFIVYKQGDISKDYKAGKSIGSGAYGQVKKVTHIKTGQTRAVKILKKSEQDTERLFLEVDILAKLCHPNIMQIFEFYDDDNYFYIISELCEGGELFDRISEKGIFTEQEAANIVKQILSAICYSHANNIVHRYINIQY